MKATIRTCCPLVTFGVVSTKSTLSWTSQWHTLAKDSTTSAAANPAVMSSLKIVIARRVSTTAWPTLSLTRSTSASRSRPRKNCVCNCWCFRERERRKKGRGEVAWSFFPAVSDLERSKAGRPQRPLVFFPPEQGERRAPLMGRILKNLLLHEYQDIKGYNKGSCSPR
jgi:hypothetical protein